MSPARRSTTKAPRRRAAAAAVETVNSVMIWLNGLFRLQLPTLPLTGLWARLTVLFTMAIRGTLPPPTLPLPWIIDIEGEWGDLFPGAPVTLKNLRIQVSAPVASPQLPPAPPKRPRAAPKKRRAAAPKKSTPHRK